MREHVKVKPLPADKFPKVKWPAALSVTAGGKKYAAERREAKGGHGEPHPPSIVLDKIDGIVKAACPDFGQLARRLVSLEPAALEMKVSDLLRAAQPQT
jgi:hypothetical protein